MAAALRELDWVCQEVHGDLSLWAESVYSHPVLLVSLMFSFEQYIRSTSPFGIGFLGIKWCFVVTSWTGKKNNFLYQRGSTEKMKAFFNVFTTQLKFLWYESQMVCLTLSFFLSDQQQNINYRVRNRNYWVSIEVPQYNSHPDIRQAMQKYKLEEPPNYRAPELILLTPLQNDS